MSNLKTIQVRICVKSIEIFNFPISNVKFFPVFIHISCNIYFVSLTFFGINIILVSWCSFFKHSISLNNKSSSFNKISTQEEEKYSLCNNLVLILILKNIAKVPVMTILSAEKF